MIEPLGHYLGLLLVALVVGAVTRRMAHLPYTISLVLVGLAIGLTEFGPDPESQFGFGRDLVFFVLLPPLLFQGAMHMNINRLRDHFWPIFVFAIVGVVLSTAVIGGALYLVGAMGSLLLALLFGAMLSPTDPVSVLGLFRELGVGEDLRTIVEGESLFNDGTGVVVFTILLDLVLRGGDFHASDAVVEFLRVAGGGLVLGAVLGYVTYLFIRQMDDPLVETAACFVLAMGSFWLAEHVFHMSGVIATVVAGLFIGNYGRHLSMSREVTIAVESFFEVIDFLINSVIFILIGLEIRPVLAEGDWTTHLPLVGAAIGAFLVARAVTVYPLFHALNLAGRRRPRRWAHILFWGGLRGSIPIALLLGLSKDEPFYEEFLVAGFAVVLFSLVIQGLTVGPLLNLLGLGAESEEKEPPPG